MNSYKLAELPSLTGTRIGTSEWVEMTQNRVNLFADATGDHQWIHVDTERAATGPFGGTIAHGYLTLSMLIPLFRNVVDLLDVGVAINYGLNKARFPNPVRVGSRVRVHVDLAETRPLPNDGIEVVWDFTIEVDGAEKPACVAQTVFRYFPEASQ